MALLCMTFTLMAQDKTITLHLIETSDVHGAFFPVDFFNNRPMEGSMARVSTYLNQLRAEVGEDAVIVLDNGDILQGQPTCYYNNYIKTDVVNVAADVINYLKYDAQTFGNHDVETGHAVYDKWIKDLKCPVLGANIINTTTGKPYTPPYTVIERRGVRVAVIGMLTPAIPCWLHESLWSGMRFDEMVSSARYWVNYVRQNERPDVVVGLFHSGWDGGISTLHYNEDASKAVAEQVDGFDVVFFGHDHTEHFSTTEKGVICLDPSCNAQKVAHAMVTLQQRDGRWNVTEKTGELVDVRRLEVDQHFVEHFQPAIDSTRAYVNRFIGVFTAPIRTRDCFFGSAPFTDFIHNLQLQITGADISLNAPLSFDIEIKAGDVFVRDMFKLYRFENQIYTLRMTGEEVRKLLEMSYDQWVNTMKSPDDHIMLLNDSTSQDLQRYGFKNLTFNFDSAAGIDYEVDVTKPDGQKVRVLRMSNGQPFDEQKSYKVVMNSYRGNGGGELLTRGAGISPQELPNRIIYQSKLDQRHYLMEEIEKAGRLNPQAHGNWRFVPEEWTIPAIARDRKLLFGVE
jgi:2',3'-cyclic-nucleotide 2'-phosphodiesterase/3'-nucleotidase